MGFSIEDVVGQMIRAAWRAGKAVMDVRKSGSLGVGEKEDGSPVGRADVEAESVIRDMLSEFGMPLVSEESFSGIPDGDFFLVDPLDGTKEFIKGLDEFTVNIALVSGGRPVAGVVFAPARNETYWSYEGRSWKGGERIHVGESRVLALSRSHLSEEMERVVESLSARLEATGKRLETVRIGSSLKICMVAEGRAGAYLRITPLRIWDIAAAHSVLEGAGGCITDWNGRRIDYGKVSVNGLRATNCNGVWRW